MAYPIYMKIEGATQGPINGSVEVEGREDSIEVHDVKHEVTTGFDPDTGIVKSNRVHKPYKIYKEIDKSSPLLHSALCNQESLTVKLDFYTVDETGTEISYFTVELVNARVNSINTLMENIKFDKNHALGHMEEVTFNYEEITWTYNDGGLMHVDSWLNREVGW